MVAIIGANDSNTIIVGSDEGNINVMACMILHEYVNLLESDLQKNIYRLFQSRFHKSNVCTIQQKDYSSCTRTPILLTAVYIERLDNINFIIEIIC